MPTWCGGFFFSRTWSHLTPRNCLYFVDSACHFEIGVMLGSVIILHYIQSQFNSNRGITQRSIQANLMFTIVHPHLFIVFLQRSKIFSSFGELTFFHAFTHIVVHEGTLRIPAPNAILDWSHWTQTKTEYGEAMAALGNQNAWIQNQNN